MELIPTSVDEISTEWFAAALQENDSKSRLQEIELIESNSGTTGRAFFRLAWSEGGRNSLPNTVFVKLPPTEAIQRQSNAEMGMGVREAKFYRVLSPEIPVLHPKSYYSNWAEQDSAYIMVLENLSETGGRPLVLGPDSEYWIAEQLIDSLATLHKNYWDTPRFETDLAWLGAYEPIRNPEPPILVDRCHRLFNDFMPPVFGEAKDLFVNKQHELADLFARGTPTLVHGDCHLSNLFIDENKKLGFYDWAIVSKMPAMWDVAYGLCISFPPEIRREAEKHLLPLYVKRLNEDGVERLSLDDAWLQYRKMAFFSWISAATTLGCGERMQPLEWGMNTIRWTTQVLSDLELLDLLRDELNC